MSLGGGYENIFHLYLREANKYHYTCKVPNTSTFITIGITTSSTYQITKIMISLLLYLKLPVLQLLILVPSLVIA